MSSYQYMNERAPKVMRIGATLFLLPVLVLLIIFNILNWRIFDLLAPWLSIILSIGVIIVLIVLMYFIIPAYRYKHFRYLLADTEIYVRTGILFVTENVIPYFRIQNININEGFIMRKFNLATITLSTAGGNSDIQLIHKDKAIQLKQRINQKRHQDLETDEDNETEDTHDLAYNNDKAVHSHKHAEKDFISQEQQHSNNQRTDGDNS